MDSNRQHQIDIFYITVGYKCFNRQLWAGAYMSELDTLSAI